MTSRSTSSSTLRPASPGGSRPARVRVASPCRAGLVVTAAALILSVVMSILLLVPINNRVKTWTADGLPADWKQQMNRWDRFHYVRVAVIVAAFALLAAALA